jgi:hypothetical protein
MILPQAAKLYQGQSLLYSARPCASKNGIILGHTDSSAAFPGMPVMAFGLLDQQTPG